MMKCTRLAGLLVLGCAAGCNPHVVIEQEKPLEININFTGHLVIEQARQDMEQITGEKPVREVRPEDIGLPPASQPGAAAGAAAADRVAWRAGEGLDSETYPILLRTRGTEATARATYPVATEDELKRSLAGRNAQVRALWDGKLVGEGHTGLLVAKAKLTAEQQALMAAENADRTALYAAEAGRRGITADEVALGHLVARLGYAKAGDWYEKYNKTTKQWEWAQWGN